MVLQMVHRVKSYNMPHIVIDALGKPPLGLLGASVNKNEYYFFRPPRRAFLKLYLNCMRECCVAMKIGLLAIDLIHVLQSRRNLCTRKSG